MVRPPAGVGLLYTIAGRFSAAPAAFSAVRNSARCAAFTRVTKDVIVGSVTPGIPEEIADRQDVEGAGKDDRRGHRGVRTPRIREAGAGVIQLRGGERICAGIDPTGEEDLLVRIDRGALAAAGEAEKTGDIRGALRH